MSQITVRRSGGAESVTPTVLTAARVAVASLNEVLRWLDSSDQGVTKKVFYAASMHPAGQRQRTRGREHRIHRRAARFSHDGTIARAYAGHVA
jgi:hypothetical protein